MGTVMAAEKKQATVKTFACELGTRPFQNIDGIEMHGEKSR